MSEGMLLPEANIAIDRRGLFTRGARLALSGTTLALLTGIGSSVGLRRASAATMSADIDTLNVALGLEHEAIAA